MPRPRWIRAALLGAGGLLALGAGAAFWAKRSPWLSERLRAPIQAALAEASGRPMSLGGVGGGLSGWIWLQEVGLGPDPDATGLDLSATAKALGLRYSLWDLARGRTGLERLKALRLEQPRFFLLRGEAEGAGAGEDWARALRSFPLPPLRLEVLQGEAWDGTRRLAHGLRLGLEPDDQGWRLRGQGDLDSGGRAALWGRSRADLGGAELKLRVVGLQLAPWGRDLVALPSGAELTQGSLDGELSLVQGEAESWTLVGRGNLQGLGLAWQGRTALEQGGTRWTLEQGELRLEALQGRGAGGRLDGGLRRTAQGHWQGKVRLRQAALEALASLAGAPDRLSLTGRADLELEALGLGAEARWQASLRASAARWAGQDLRRLDALAQWQGLSRKATVELAWEGGEGRLNLEAGPQGWTRAHAEARALPVAWPGAWAALDLKGSVDGRWIWQGGVEQGPWTLDLRSPRLDAAGLALEGLRLSGGGGGGQARLRMEAGLEHWPGLNASLEAVQEGEAWDLRRLRVFEGERLRAEASGRLRQGALSLDLRHAEAPLAAIKAWLPPAWQGVEGALRVQGRLQWGPEGGRGGLDLSAPGLRLRGRGLPATARLDFAPGGVTLSAVDLRQGEVKGRAAAPGWKGPWSADLALRRLSLPEWLALAGAPALLSGTASGSLGLGPARMAARLDLDSPWPQALSGAAASVALKAAQGRWELERLQLRQGEGRLDASGVLDLGGSRPWSGQARWQGLRLRGSLFEGEAALQAHPGAAGRLRVGPWSLAHTALPELNADLQVKGQRLDAIQADLGPGTRLQLKRQPQRWWLRADLAGQDLGPLVGPWSAGRNPDSGLKLDGWAEASLPHGDQALSRWKAELGSGADGGRLSAEGPAWPWALERARFSGWDLARLAQAARSLGLGAWPLQAGRLEGEAVSASGGLSLSARVQGLKALGAELGPAQAQAWVGERRWSVQRLHAGGPGPRLRLEQWSGRRGGGWGGEGRIELEQWPAAIFQLSGEGSLRLQGPRAGRVLAEARWARLRVSEREYQGLGLALEWDAGRWALTEGGKPSSLRAQGRVADGVFELEDLQAAAGKGRAWLKGKVGPQEALRFEGGAQGFPVGELTGWLGWPQEWKGAAYGSLSLTGSVAQPQGVILVRVEDGSVAGLPFDLATALVHLEPGWVQLSPLRPIRLGRRNGVALEVSGRVPLGDAQGRVPESLDVAAELKGGGWGLLAGLPAVASAEGPLELKLHFSGRRDDPRVDGRLRASGGRLEPAWLLTPLGAVELFAQIEDGQVRLHKAEARAEGGEGPLLRLEPADPDRPAFRFERWLPADFNLRLRASRSGLPLRHTRALRFVEGQAHPDLRLAGSWRDPRLEGELRLDKGGLDKALVLWPPQRVRTGGAAAPGGFLDQLEYHLRLHARQDVMVRTEAAQAFVDSGENGLLLSGAGRERELEGRLRFTRGSMDYLLASFQLAPDKETRVDFRRGSPPELELWGFKRLRGVLLQGEQARRDVEVRLHAYGPLGAVRMRLESDDPGLSQQQLASLAGLGLDAGDPRTQGGFARLLGRVPGHLLTGLVRRSGVVDDVGVRLPAVEDALAGAAPTPEPGQAASAPQDAALTGTSRTLVAIDAGKYVGERLYLGLTGQLQERETGAGGARSVDPALGGRVEYQLQDSTRVSAQHSVDREGQTEQRVMLERSARFENYNPRRRRWDQVTPTPTPRP